MTVDSAADFLLEYLTQLINCDNEFIAAVYEAKVIVKEQMEWIYEEMQFLRKFLKDSEHIRNEVEEVVAKIRALIYEVEVIIDSFLLDVAKPVPVREDALFKSVHPGTKNGNSYEESYDEKLIIRYQKDAKILQQKQFDTRLAEYESHHGIESVREEIKFIKTEVMQVYEKMIYGSGAPPIKKSSPRYSVRATSLTVEREMVVGLEDEKLGEELYKHLKGNRYLIVMDDIWNIIHYNNGSRIIFTTRLGDVAASLHAKPYHMRFLNEDESWDLLQHKAFQDESCPPDLKEIGKIIAQKCGGLPLAIVVVSGLLANENEKTRGWWRHVATSVGSYIVRDPEQYMDTLALSYDYMPNHLKPCFLYFGAFPEDCEIPVWQLIWLWVAEGFIRHNVSKSLEDVAADNLMDLISRSLVVVSKKGSNGGIKACRIHDLLRDLCLRKAQDENFLHEMVGYKRTTTFFYRVASKQRRLCISHLDDDYIIINHALYVRSFLSLDHSFHDFPKNYVSSICENFKLLRVLNLSSINMPHFPREIGLLIHLRYLALHNASHGYFNSSISNLWNLESYIVGGFGAHVYLPDSVWKMLKLRHLYTKHFFKLPLAINLRYHSTLNNLQTIGKLDLRGRKGVLEFMPNLRKLKCVCDRFLKLDFLIHLETLHVISDEYKRNLVRLPQKSWFPPNLKNLTLSFFRLPWEEMWTLARLPNLEVLKLSYEAFKGSTWDPNDGEFRTLRFLKLRGPDIEQWNASSNHFPNLQQLVLDRCQQLKEIPNGLGDISTLEMIQLQYCSSSAETSARQ